MKNSKSIIFILPLIFLLLSFLLHSYSPDIYYRLFGVLEGGIFEWVQFACYILAAYIGLKTYFINRKYLKSLTQKTILLLFTFGCFFIALEEVSYGQHLFKWSGHIFFSSENIQKETNIHNLKFIQGEPFLFGLTIYFLSFISVCAYGSFSWLLKFSRIKSPVLNLVVVDWWLMLYFLPVLLYMLQDLKPPQFINYMHQEVFESLLAFGFLAISINNFSKIKIASNKI
jgi:hypothetical protein